jgi:hypothetical protein
MDLYRAEIICEVETCITQLVGCDELTNCTTDVLSLYSCKARAPVRTTKHQTKDTANLFPVLTHM